MKKKPSLKGGRKENVSTQEAELELIVINI